MTRLTPDFLEIIKTLLKHKVEFVVICCICVFFPSTGRSGEESSWRPSFDAGTCTGRAGISPT